MKTFAIFGMIWAGLLLIFSLAMLYWEGGSHHGARDVASWFQIFFLWLVVRLREVYWERRVQESSSPYTTARFQSEVRK